MVEQESNPSICIIGKYFEQWNGKLYIPFRYYHVTGHFVRVDKQFFCRKFPFSKFIYLRKLCIGRHAKVAHLITFFLCILFGKVFLVLFPAKFFAYATFTVKALMQFFSRFLLQYHHLAGRAEVSSPNVYYFQFHHLPKQRSPSCSR